MSDAAAAMTAFLDEQGVTIRATFVPLSQSKNAQPSPLSPDGKPWESLNWRVEVLRHGRAVTTCDYGQGIGHIPGYQEHYSGRRTLNKDAIISRAVERGVTPSRPALALEGRGYSAERPIAPPAAADVLFSLAMDASVLDYPSFSAWAEEYGYSDDSRAAEASWKACMETALTLRAALGNDGLERLSALAAEM